MAVKIRLRRMGAKKAPFYRVVVADSRYPRDGRFIEEIGLYNPLLDPPEIKIDTEKAQQWLSTVHSRQILSRICLKRAELLNKEIFFMKDLLVSIAQGLVEDPDAVSVTVDEPDDEGVVVYHLHVSENDMAELSASRAESQKLFVLSCVPRQHETTKRFR
jgi:small subunit ribosomal protein S16